MSIATGAVVNARIFDGYFGVYRGVVRGFSSEEGFAVEFTHLNDETLHEFHGHDCDGMVGSDQGWWCKAEELEVIT